MASFSLSADHFPFLLLRELVLLKDSRRSQPPSSTFPRVSGSHELWNKHEHEQYQQNEHDGRSKEGQHDDDHYQCILYQAQWPV